MQKQITIQRTDTAGTREKVGPLRLQMMVGWIRLQIIHGTHPVTGKIGITRVVLSKDEANLLGRMLVKFSNSL
ncbi:MAG: hypothetical protein D4R73_09300 [Deltaproteobacteria bacterium]|nr:MAG: hypothetical protein D4R73_09300 [Deltaproteobacteria bacterium]